MTVLFLCKTVYSIKHVAYTTRASAVRFAPGGCLPRSQSCCSVNNSALLVKKSAFFSMRFFLSLPLLVRGSLIFTFISIYEAFGIVCCPDTGACVWGCPGPGTDRLPDETEKVDTQCQWGHTCQIRIQYQHRQGALRCAQCPLRNEKQYRQILRLQIRDRFQRRRQDQNARRVRKFYTGEELYCNIRPDEGHFQYRIYAQSCRFRIL